MLRSRSLFKSSVTAALAASVGRFVLNKPVIMDDDQANLEREKLKGQPAFVAVNNMRIGRKKNKVVTLDSMTLITGSAHKQLSAEISKIIGVPLANAALSRFADGEVSVQINENIRGKDVFIVQSCAAPVNDSIMELLLTVSCARRSGARRIVAVIPYFGYKHHRRGAAISTRHNSRFLSSTAMDFSKMLQEMGVDRVIAVDLQRPGQGSEACFFDNKMPVEAVITTDDMVDHFIRHVDLKEPVVVVTPNSECVKKARNFQLRLQKAFRSEVKLVAFFPSEAHSGATDVDKLELIGKAQFDGADVVIVDDMVDTAGTLNTLSKRLEKLGARNTYVCASHGLFTENASKLIADSPVNKVIVTNTLPLPKDMSGKVEQLSVAPMLAHVILAEHFRSINVDLGEEFEMDD